MFIWIIAIILIIVIGICIYGAHFFVNVAFYKDSTWFAKKGHALFNPDNFNREKTVYTEIEDRQNEEGHRFWEEEATEEIFMKWNNETLCAREFKAMPHSNKWIIAVHGYRSSGKRDMSYPAKVFNEVGFNVLVPDLQSHGKSTGNEIGMGWLEKENVKAWIDKIISHYPEAEITLFGGSMGAATVMMTSGEELPKQVKVLVADCGYTTVYNEFSYLLSSALKLPASPILFFANFFAKSKLGFTLKEASSVDQLKKNTRPILFFHGTADKFVPHEMVYQNMEATTSVKEVMIVENAPHLCSWVYDETRYFKTVLEFIDENLTKGEGHGN